jgi:hypothetical protein
VPGAAPAPYVSTTCNAFGVDPGHCPDGFHCGTPRPLSPTYDQALCEPDDVDPWSWTLDLAPPETEPTRQVTLTFTRNGEAWPESTPESAGTLVLTRGSDGARRVVPMPTDAGGTLTFAVPEGTWSVSFGTSATVPLDSAKYPSIRRPASLVVHADGDDTVDVAAWILELTARLDGAGLPSVPADGTWTWSLWSPTGTAYAYVGTGEAIRRRWVVEPGPWDVTATLGGDAWPDGARTWEEAITEDDLDGRNVAAFEATLTSSPVSGTVRIDGTTASANRAVLWTGAQGSESFDVVTTSGVGRYEGRVLDGAPYAVALRSYSSPDGVWQASAAQTPGVFDVRATVVPWAGTVTANGVATRGSVYADITHTAADGSYATLDVSGVSGAAFDGLAWDKVGETRVEGDGVRLPGGSFLVESGTRPRTGRAYDLQGVSVTVHATLNGADVEQTASTYYGSVSLTQIDPSTGAPLPATAAIVGAATEGWTHPGPFTATVLVPAGTYALSGYFTDNELTPAGFPSLGTATVRRATTLNVDAQTWRSTLTLQSDGASLPAVPGGDRGEITVGAARTTIPGGGPSRVTVEGWVSEAPAYVMWTCYGGSTCGSTAYNPGYLFLWSGMWMVPP